MKINNNYLFKYIEALVSFKMYCFTVSHNNMDYCQSNKVNITEALLYTSSFHGASELLVVTFFLRLVG